MLRAQLYFLLVGVSHLFFSFRIIVMLTTYFYGCWWLPVMLTMLDFDVVKLGKPASMTSENGVVAAGGSDPKDKVVEDEEVIEA
jgi:hypothetical protein